jgi:thiamine biosynthesis lipoprotein
MGSEVRLLIGAPLVPGDPDPCDAAERARAYVEDFAARLSRFSAASELSALNSDSREVVPASPLLRAAVHAAVWAAEATDGLVDPTLIPALERIGYGRSLDGAEPASLREALDAAPARRPARPNPRSVWRAIAIDDAAGHVRRPPGVTIDTGGTGKGLCADAVAHLLARYTRYVVDCGGDLAIGGVDSQLHPWEVEALHPLSGEVICAIRVACGGIATSGLNVRVWRDDAGYRHHLLDPSTGEPAWTGLIGVTALGSCALESEVLAKAALLRGAGAAREILAEHGGLLVHDDGDVERIGPLVAPARSAVPA